MIRSMSAALSGLRSHQAMLDVVGNNIANISTPGFKGSTAVFEDVLTQTIRGAGAPAGNLAGTNPNQVGLGVRLAGTAQQMGQGALQRTGRAIDLGIQGDGFFITDLADQRLYTRAGSFTIDGEGRLSTPAGGIVLGWQAGIDGTINTNGDVGAVVIAVGSQLPPKVTETVRLGGNLPAGDPNAAEHVTGVTIFDSQGIPTQITFTFTKNAANTWDVTATYGDNNTAVAVAGGALSFDSGGELTAPASRALTITGGLIPGFAGDVSIDLGDAGAPGRLIQFAGRSSVVTQGQDGFSAGVLQSYSVTQEGILQGFYSNGMNQSIGQVAMAVFANAEGLERVAGSWRETPNSGLGLVGTALTGGRGQINPGTIEMSNVDLTQEFTNLIVAQRGFQANSRVITASDEILQEVVNLKR